MEGGKELTDSKNIGYNKGSPFRCECHRVIAFKKDGKIYVKCQDCKKWVAVLAISEIKEAQ